MEDFLLKRVLPAFVILGVLGLLAMVPAMLPTRLAGVRAPQPLHDTGQRRPAERCSLVQSASCEPIAVRGVQAEEVAFPSRHAAKGLGELRGTLSLPQLESPEPRPAVVLIHGSGPNTRDQPLPGDLLSRFSPPVPVFALLAEHFANRGFVVLRYDKRSSKPYREQWAMDSKTFAFTDFRDDALDALDFLASRPEVDPDALVVLGHSQGGMFAPTLTEDPRVAAVVMLAGSSQTFEELVVGQLERLQAIRRRQWDFFSPLAIELQRARMAQCFSTAAADDETFCLGGGVTQRALHGYEQFNRSLPAAIAAVDVPLFAAQGVHDINVDPQEIPRLKRLLAGKDAEFHLLPELGHTFARDTPEGAELDAELLARLDAFLASVARPPEPAGYGEPAP